MLLAATQLLFVISTTVRGYEIKENKYRRVINSLIPAMTTTKKSVSSCAKFCAHAANWNFLYFSFRSDSLQCSCGCQLSGSPSAQVLFLCNVCHCVITTQMFSHYLMSVMLI